MSVLIVESEGNKSVQGLFGRLMLQIQRSFNVAYLAVCFLKDGNVQALLAAKIVVDHPLAGLSARRNVVDPCATQPFASKLLRRNFDDVALGSLGIVDPPAPRLGKVEGFVLHSVGGSGEAGC